MDYRNAGFTYFDRVLDWCRKENLYVFLDMHCAPGGQTSNNKTTATVTPGCTTVNLHRMNERNMGKNS